MDRDSEAEQTRQEQELHLKRVWPFESSKQKADGRSGVCSEECRILILRLNSQGWSLDISIHLWQVACCFFVQFHSWCALSARWSWSLCLRSMSSRVHPCPSAPIHTTNCAKQWIISIQRHMDAKYPLKGESFEDSSTMDHHLSS